MSEKKVLICPLNWGLGHATRDVPIIKALIKNEFKLTIAADEAPYEFLKREFPDLSFIRFKGYAVRYSKSKSQILKMMMLVPSILFWTIKEHLTLKKIIQENNIDIVISDNRYGLWNKNVHSIFISHQLNIKFPKSMKFFEPVFHQISNRLIKMFDACWVPDSKGPDNLSGELSHGKNTLENRIFIGPLSRFESKTDYSEKQTIDVLFILSGPEPQRSILERLIYEQTKNKNRSYVLVRGTEEQCKNDFCYPIFNILNTKELGSLINKANLIVCRSGYSSVMDLVALKKKAVLISTPGQTEQEYLAQYLMTKGFFYAISQEDFCLQTAMKNAFEFPEIALAERINLEGLISNLKK